MLVDIGLALLGLVILLLGGDALVKGAVNLALRLGIPALLVSLTIVAFGTSAPELLISIAAVQDGAPGIALGNVVGSNIANILLVLGIPAMIAVMHTSECDSRKTYIMMLASTVLFIGLGLTGTYTWWTGLILLAALGLVLGDSVRDARQHRRDSKSAAAQAARDGVEVEGADDSMPGWKVGMFLALGLIGLPLGADIFVNASVSIAERLNVSDTVIGLTLVAVGTSLPELATTVAAAIRRQADVALGNVIGSNIFNLLAIIGIASLVGPIPVDPTFVHFDFWVMLGASLLLAPVVLWGKDMGRIWGIGLSAAYIVFLILVVT